ncbi:MAG: ABC transporter substrate-binding protein [Desulfobacterales bacterium]|nr:ABC transporter substrate-binding protein [Desulfobacterales bacterium]
MREKKSGVILGCALAFILMVSSVSMAQSELRVGWDADQALSSLQLGSSWQTENQGCMFWQLIYDTIWTLGEPPNYEFAPWGITGYESADRKTFRFFIRKDMTFHDGKPVTAEDFAFTMKHLPDSDPEWNYSDTITDKDSFTIIDDHTLEFTMINRFGGKYPPFNWFPVFPKHLWSRYKYDMLKNENKKAIGSGPFKLADYKSGQYMIFEKHEGHWNKEPRVDKITFKSYGGSDAMNMALKKGDIDMLGYGGISTLAKRYFKDNPDIDLIKSDGIALQWLTFNNFMEENGLQDLNVRTAIAHGIDRDTLVKMIYHGGAISHDSFIYPELPEYNDRLPKYPFNPELSNKLLDDNGYVDTDEDDIRNVPDTGKNMSYRFLVPSDSVDDVKLATLLREMMKKIGINLKLNVTDYGTYTNIYWVPDEKLFDIALGMEEPGPYADWVWEFMRSYDDGGYGWNAAGYNNPDFDKALNAYSAELDVAKRIELSKKMQFYMSRDIPYLVLTRKDIIDPVRVDKLEGYVAVMGGVSNWINPFSYFYVHPKTQ